MGYKILCVACLLAEHIILRELSRGIASDFPPLESYSIFL